MFVQIGYIGLTVGVRFNAEELCDEEIKTRLTVWVSCIPSGEVGLLALHQKRDFPVLNIRCRSSDPVEGFETQNRCFRNAVLPAKYENLTQRTSHI